MVFLNETFDSELIIDSHTVVKNNTEKSHIEFSPVVISGKAIVQYHNQYSDIDTLKIKNTCITTRIPGPSLL